MYNGGGKIAKVSERHSAYERCEEKMRLTRVGYLVDVKANPDSSHFEEDCQHDNETSDRYAPPFDQRAFIIVPQKMRQEGNPRPETIWVEENSRRMGIREWRRLNSIIPPSTTKRVENPGYDRPELRKSGRFPFRKSLYKLRRILANSAWVLGPPGNNQ